LGPAQRDATLHGIKLSTRSRWGESKAEEIEAGLEVRFHANAGEHSVGVAFLDKSLAPEGMLHPPLVQWYLYNWRPRAGDPGVAELESADRTRRRVPEKRPAVAGFCLPSQCGERRRAMREKDSRQFGAPRVSASCH